MVLAASHLRDCIGRIEHPAMNISDKDLKKLWGLAAGICSRPGCGQDCIVFVDANDPTVIGEMAHVIAQSPTGPRGKPGGGPDTYENLVLLCPSDHRLVDKAPPGQFTEAVLHRWKEEHEAWVRERLRTPHYRDKKELANALLRLLKQNHGVWKTYGPESDIAQANPVSNAAGIWTLRKLSTIIPNNRRIAAALEAHGGYFTADEYDTVVEFLEHAAGFEASAYERRDSVPRFPQVFQEMIARAAAE